MDMEISDEESEDGQITKYDEEEEKERKLLEKLNSGHRKAEEDDRPVELADLEKCRLTRNMLDKYCTAPWFEEYVQGERNFLLTTFDDFDDFCAGAFVRYLIGEDNGPVYRICEVSSACLFTPLYISVEG